MDPMASRLGLPCTLPGARWRPLAGAAALLLSCASQAALISGFESGLSGWETTGDVSVQTAAIGMAPTEGRNLAFLTTMTDRQNPYSGTPANFTPPTLLGLPQHMGDFLDQFPPLVSLYPNTFGSGAKIRFYASDAGRLTFDWNKIGFDTDFAYLSLWSDDASYRFNDWIYQGPRDAGPSDVEFCDQVFGPVQPYPDYCELDRDGYNIESGWSTRSLYIAQAGWYTIGFATGSTVDQSAPTILVLDNVAFSVPVPSSALLVATALLGLALTGRGGRARGQPG